MSTRAGQNLSAKVTRHAEERESRGGRGVIIARGLLKGRLFVARRLMFGAPLFGGWYLEHWDVPPDFFLHVLEALGDRVSGVGSVKHAHDVFWRGGSDVKEVTSAFSSLEFCVCTLNGHTSIQQGQVLL